MPIVQSGLQVKILVIPLAPQHYFEALEVLNQRDYLIRNANEDNVDGGPDDGGNEPPDDGSSDTEEEKEGPYSYVPRKRWETWMSESGDCYRIGQYKTDFRTGRKVCPFSPSAKSRTAAAFDEVTALEKPSVGFVVCAHNAYSQYSA